MRTQAIIIAALALSATLLTAAAAAAAPAPSTVRTAADPDQVSMSTSSWGKPIARWTIRPDGSGEVATSKQVSKDFTDFVVVTRRLDAAPGRYDRIIGLLRVAEPYAGKSLPCGPRMTDAPYGEVSWRREGVTRALSVDYGCQSAEAIRVLDQLDAAQNLVAGWAANAPVISEDKPRAPEGSH